MYWQLTFSAYLVFLTIAVIQNDRAKREAVGNSEPQSETTPEPEVESTAEGEGEPGTCGSRPAGNSDTTGSKL